MEVKEKSKKRELIKSIAIVFLVILLILTFFSNTFMNYSLPEVATKVVSSGTINTRIRGSGTVAANESYEVVLDQTREVRSICVKVGDAVEQGDLLFVLGDIESEELKAAQEALRNAEIDYQRQILNLSKEYTMDDMTVRGIREALEKAIGQRDNNRVTDAEISYAKGDVASAESELSQVQMMIEELQAEQSGGNGGDTDMQEQISELDGRIAKLESRIEGLNADIKQKNDTIQGYNDKITELNEKIQTDEASLRTLGSGTDLDSERAVQDAKKALDTAQTAWETTWARNLDYLRQYSAAFGSLGNSPRAFSSSEQVNIERQLSSLKQSEENTKENLKDENGDSVADTYHYIYDEVYSAYQAVLTAQNAVDSAQTAYSRALENKTQSVEKAQKELQQQINTTKTELSGVQRQLSAAQRELAAARDDLSNAQLELSLVQDQRRLAQDKSTAAENASSAAAAQLKERIKSCQASERELKVRIEELKDAQAALEEKKAKYDAALQEIDTQQKALEQELSGKDIDKQLNDLNLQTMRLDIEQKREQVERLQENSVDTEVKAKVSGVIAAINVTAGKENAAGQAMAVINVVDRGYVIEVSVTNEQAKQVKVGDSAEVVNTRWGSEINATLEAITSDPSAPGQRRILVFRISGDVDAGSNITLSIGQRSTVSDTVVPKSALREDTNGKFVLVITSKSTPLGNRYTATRVDVQVIAEDDNNAAVSGVAANDYVITTSSKPIDPGSLVRMVENP